MCAAEASADVERERAYQLAETLNSHLDDVAKNLGAMITELNSANSPQSHQAESREVEGIMQERDGSIAQIVAILNAHLASLKWIDHSSNALRGRLEALRRGQL